MRGGREEAREAREKEKKKKERNTVVDSFMLFSFFYFSLMSFSTSFYFDLKENLWRRGLPTTENEIRS